MLAATIAATACADGSEVELAALRADVAAVREEIVSVQEQMAVVPPPAPTTAEPADTSNGDVERLEAEIARLTSEMESRTALLKADADFRPSFSLSFTLQILHASDMDGAPGALQNVENFSAILDGFRAQFPDNTLVLSSGDNYIPGPRYFAAADVSNQSVLGMPGNGRADIAFLNAMGFHASALGNHELDRGTGVFDGIIGSETKLKPR